MIPLATRSSNVRALALDQCHGAWALKHTFPDVVKDATYFEMGNLIHSGIRQPRKTWCHYSVTRTTSGRGAR